MHWYKFVFVYNINVKSGGDILKKDFDKNDVEAQKLLP